MAALNPNLPHEVDDDSDVLVFDELTDSDVSLQEHDDLDDDLAVDAMDVTDSEVSELSEESEHGTQGFWEWSKTQEVEEGAAFRAWNRDEEFDGSDSWQPTTGIMVKATLKAHHPAMWDWENSFEPRSPNMDEVSL
jgi:hypothetical protein